MIFSTCDFFYLLNLDAPGWRLHLSATTHYCMEKPYYAGVTEHKSGYIVQLNRKGTMFYLGTYETAQAAAGYADRATLLSAPWVVNRRRARLNVPDSELPHPDHYTQYEKQMLSKLREIDDAAEREFHKKHEVEKNLPVVISQLDYFMQKREGFKELEDETWKDMESAVRNIAEKLRDLQERHTWALGVINDQQREIGILKGTRDPNAPAGKFQFRPVVPKGIPEPVAPAEPAAAAISGPTASPAPAMVDLGPGLALSQPPLRFEIEKPSPTPKQSPAGEEVAEESAPLGSEG